MWTGVRSRHKFVGIYARATVAGEFVALLHCPALCRTGHSGVQRLQDEPSRCDLSAVHNHGMSSSSTHIQMTYVPNHMFTQTHITYNQQSATQCQLSMSTLFRICCRFCREKLTHQNIRERELHITLMPASCKSKCLPTSQDPLQPKVMSTSKTPLART